MPRTFAPGVLIVTLAIALLAAALVWRSDRHPEGGDLWRRGFLGGDEILLMPGQRYEIQRWSCIGAGELVENGTWTRLGDIVSLVPSAPGRPARVLRIAVEGDTRLLYEPAPGGGRPHESEIYERMD